MASIVHFEIPADNIERAKKFYDGLFGWKAERTQGASMEGGPIEYWTFRTGNEKEEQQPISGGIMNRMYPKHSITNYIGVDSAIEYSKRSKGLEAR
jgi:predicted enzyme related to lactoylglutathione lyase